MTTNRMGLEQTLSDERLEQVANIGSIEQMALPPSHAQCAAMARELLAYRKASKDVYGYVNKAVFEMTGSVGLSNDHEHCADSPSYIPLYAAPPLQAVIVPDEMTPEMMRAVQLNSELGAYAASNLCGAYSLFDEFWGVACRAAMLSEPRARVEATSIDIDSIQYQSLNRGE